MTFFSSPFRRTAAFSQKHVRLNFSFPSKHHKVLNIDYFRAACYGYAIIRFLCLKGLQGVDHCYFMMHVFLASFKITIFC